MLKKALRKATPIKENPQHRMQNGPSWQPGGPFSEVRRGTLPACCSALGAPQQAGRAPRSQRSVSPCAGRR